MQENFFVATNKDFDRIFEIMSEAFPINEMRDKENHYNIFCNNKHYKIHCAADDCGTVVGFIVVWDLGQFIFIENFATVKELRGKGLGGGLLEYVLQVYNKDAILEVEPPIDLMKSRRVQFYERHDFVYHDFDYLMPPIRKGEDYLPLKIMAHNQKFNKDSFEEYKKLIYSVVYGVL